MKIHEVRTQIELDKAIAKAKPDDSIWIMGEGWFAITGTDLHVVARGSSHVVAWGSSHVVAWGSSHVVAWESSHVEAWGSSHVEAWGSSHVVAWGSSHVVAWGSSHVVARESSHVESKSKHVAVHSYSSRAELLIEAGVLITVEAPKDGAEWCSYYGVPVEDGIAVLYKAVDDDFSTSHARPAGISYAPGSTPSAPDWDGGKVECGYGLHFSPTPLHAVEFQNGPRFVACPVLVSEIVVHKEPQYPAKVKAPRVAAPTYEVTRYGERVTAAVAK